jgi:creatinine amidohydrolase
MYNMTVEEIRQGLKETQTVILPVGVVEQHGYHLPLGTDTHHAVELARLASEQTGCFVLPPMNYSFSGGALPGTINLPPQLYSLVLMEVCHSLVEQGFKNIVFLLGHGGTEFLQASQDAAENFQRLNPRMEGVTVSIIKWWLLSEAYSHAHEESDFHAGKYETSLMLHWHPELVKLDRARLDKPHIMAMMAKDPDAFIAKTQAVDSEFIVPKMTQHSEIEIGVMGNYAGASAELGKRIADEITVNVVAMIRQLQALE